MCNVKRQKDSGVVADILVDIKKNKWSWTGHEMALSRWWSAKSNRISSEEEGAQ